MRVALMDSIRVETKMGGYKQEASNIKLLMFQAAIVMQHRTKGILDRWAAQLSRRKGALLASSQDN